MQMTITLTEDEIKQIICEHICKRFAENNLAVRHEQICFCGVDSNGKEHRSPYLSLTAHAIIGSGTK